MPIPMSDIRALRRSAYEALAHVHGKNRTDLLDTMTGLEEARDNLAALAAGIHYDAVFPGFDCDEPDAADWHARQHAEDEVERAVKGLRLLLDELDAGTTRRAA